MSDQTSPSPNLLSVKTRPAARSWSSPSRILQGMRRKKDVIDPVTPSESNPSLPPLNLAATKGRTLKEIMGEGEASLTPRELLRSMRRERVKGLMAFQSSEKFMNAMAAADGEDVGDERQSCNLESQSIQFSRCIQAFNDNADEGIRKFIEFGFIDDSPLDIANLFVDTDGLSRVQIGCYIGGESDFNRTVLRSFVKQFSFEGLEIDDAMRIFFVSFVLPGESQIIERVMEAFATHYAFCNPDSPLSDSATALVLAFSLIMLNTDLHHPDVKTKMTKDQFLSNFEGISEDKRLPKSLLSHAYDRIRHKELKLTADDSEHLHLFLRPEHRGWLSKTGGRQKTWKRRWFILKSNMLFYFQDPQDELPLGTIPLTHDVHIRSAQRPNTFELYSDQNRVNSCKRSSSGIFISGQHRRFLFAADSPEECAKWIERISNALVAGAVTRRSTEIEDTNLSELVQGMANAQLPDTDRSKGVDESSDSDAEPATDRRVSMDNVL